MNVPNEQVQESNRKVEVAFQIDADLVEQLRHLTNDPGRVIETAVRQWLRGTLPREDDIARSFPRNPPVPTRGEWND